MKNNSYADEMVATKLLLAGLKANGARMSKWGYGAEFSAELEGLYRDMLRLGNEQQALKSRLKEKTAAVNQTIAAIQKLRGPARRQIKWEMPRESWREFGIADSR